MPSRPPQSPAPRLSRGKRVLFKSLVVALAAVIGSCGVETYFRITRPDLDLDVLTGRRTGRHPMAAWAQVDAFAAYRGRPGRYGGQGGKTVNRHGFISTPELAPDKPPGTIRVVVLGGSSTAGTGRLLPDVETWPAKVGEILRARHPGLEVEIINAALGGYSTFESYGRFWSRVRFFDPDVAVLYHGWNDLKYFRNPGDLHDYRTRGDGSWSFEQLPEKVRVIEPHAVDPWISWSSALTLLRLRLAGPLDGEARAGNAVTLGSDWDPAGPGTFRTQLRLFRETADVLDVDLFVAKQATLIVPDLDPALREVCRYEHVGLDHDAAARAFGDLYGIIDDEIAAGRIIDATELSGRAELFYDHVHPRPRGADALARLVADAIEPRILQISDGE